MNDKEELKQIYDIFADCWRLYKKLYPPGRPEDDAYWQGMMKELEVLQYWAKMVFTMRRNWLNFSRSIAL